MRSGCFSFSGHFGLSRNGSTYTRLPPGVSKRKVAWPSQVSCTSGIAERNLAKADQAVRGDPRHLSLQLELADRLRLELCADLRVGRVADDDLARLCGR